MDDALVQALKILNKQRSWVLILVVMDDALVLEKKEFIKMLVFSVLILVVMDDALVLDYGKFKEIQIARLNPCCNG